MSGLGDGARNRGDVRPRADCPRCGRSTAVTFNKRTGEAYLRPHNNEAARQIHGKAIRCTLSGRAVAAALVHQPARSADAR